MHDGSVYCKHLSSIHITTQAHQQSTFRALSSSCLMLHTKEHNEQHFIPVPAIATNHPSTQQTVGKASSAQPFDPNDQQQYFLTDQYTDAQRLQRFEENTGKRTTTCCILICVLFSIVLFAGGTLLVVSKVLRDQWSMIVAAQQKAARIARLVAIQLYKIRPYMLEQFSLLLEVWA